MMEITVWARFFIYGVIGCAFEIVFTGIKHLVASRFKDWSLRGKSYIWMLPIYGLIAFLFEPAHEALRSFPWPLRGIVYTIGLWIVEFITGWLLRLTTGRCPWDYSNRTKYHFQGLIRWDYAPVWFVFCLALEPIHDMLLRIRIIDSQ